MNAPARIFDAHNHLQDDRFAGQQETILRAAAAAGIAGMVVNGACESDWPAVSELAARHPGLVLPSFGWHPWYLDERGPDWETALEQRLEQHPEACVGEIGLDRWMLDNPGRWRSLLADAGQNKSEPPSFAVQEAAFTAQLRLAARMNRPANIHCLQAFGRLRELLVTTPRPDRGFLLHSYGGPAELVPVFARMGAYFSFPGYFLHERKAKQRDVFRSVPPERLLVETDAPDQMPPESAVIHPLAGPAGRPLNHPANLPAICRNLAEFLGLPEESLAAQVAQNFARLFGR